MKTLRIAELHSKLKKGNLNNLKPIKDIHLFPGIIITFLIEMVLLAIWGGISKPYYQQKLSNGALPYRYSACYFGKHATIFVAIQLTYFALLLLIGCYYAIRVRNFKMRTHSETNELLFAIYTFAMFSVMVVIIQLTTNSLVAINPILVAIICCLAPCISITCLYGQRIFNILFKEDFVDTREFTNTYSTKTISSTPSQK